MKIQYCKWTIIIGVFISLTTIGCGSSNTDAATQPDSAADKQNMQIANPASQNCLQEGGDLNMLDDDGGQIGVCVFDDDSRCEEWRLMRGECVKGKCQDKKGLCE